MIMHMFYLQSFDPNLVLGISFQMQPPFRTVVVVHFAAYQAHRWFYYGFTSLFIEMKR
ncbi:hypothetical protein ACU8KH_01266 [Lachancea thermotolerans]